MIIFIYWFSQSVSLDVADADADADAAPAPTPAPTPTLTPTPVWGARRRGRGGFAVVAMEYVSVFVCASLSVCRQRVNVAGCLQCTFIDIYYIAAVRCC
uniref:Secreted protein n=1 Tax=Syphacia muris TaxID=451379 RepID=A0A0N5AGW2_9BILA